MAFKPATGQAALNPILYCPFDDPTAPYRNDGTGQDLTANGTVARSGRGPNQVNPAASTLDGANDYLSRATLSGLAAGKAGTLVFTTKPTASGLSSSAVFASGDRFVVIFNSGKLDIDGFNSSAVKILDFSTTGTFDADKFYTIAVTWNMADTGQRDIQVDGVSISGVWSTYTDDNIDYIGSTTGTTVAATVTGTAKFSGELSDFWFDDAYHADLSGFYDTDTGKAKYLGVNGELPTGSAPVAYWPLNAADPGRDASGNGNTLTVNSGPYPGARGPNEAWLNSIELSGSGQYFLRGGDLTGNANSKSVCGLIAVKRDTTGAETLWDSGAGQFRIAFDASNFIVFTAKNTGGTTILNVRTSAISDTNWHLILFSFPMDGTGRLYVDGSSDLTSTTFTDDTIDFTATEHAIGATTAGATLFNGKLALWLGIGQTSDFSQEANRLLFVDAFQYPTDLGADGSTPTGTAPIVFATNSNGTNAGSGGDLTATGSPTDGGFVRG